MFKFWKIKKKENEDKFTYIVTIDDMNYPVSFEVYKHVNMLNATINELKNELNEIKPIVENKKIKPAVSRECGYCKFVVRSRINNSILGCCYDNVCENYVDKYS